METSALETSVVDYVLGQLAGVERLGCRAMFGGYGLYCGSTFFGIVSRGGLYLKTDDATVRRFAGSGAEPFQPGGPDALRNYYRVPADVLRNRECLTRWANAAVLCAAGRSTNPSLAATTPPECESPAWASPPTNA